jgi:hypothetical protein
VDGAGDQVEVMTAIAKPIPPSYFCRMIRAPQEDAPRIGVLSDSILRIFNRDPSIAAELETYRFPLDEAPAAFEAAGDRRSGATKVVIE